MSLQTALNQVYIGNREVSLRHFLDALDMILAGEHTAAEALTNAQEHTVTEITGLEVASGSTPIPTVIVSVPEETTLDEDVTIITFSRLDRLFGTVAFDLLRDQFQQTNPNFHIEFVPVRLSGLVTFPQLAAEADCFQWIPRLQDATARASVLNLEPFIAADSSFNMDDFFPATITPFTVQGQLWGLPANSRPYVIEYNKDLFDAAGVVYPSQQWTVDDFLDIAVTLTRGEGSRKVYGFVPDRSESESLLALSEQLGAVWVDNTIDPPRTGFTQPATVEAIRWYMQLSTEYGVKPVFDGTQTEDRDSLIREGRAGMWITLSPGEYEMPDVGVAPLPFPVDSTAVPGATQLSGYFISGTASPETRQACWQWITFLTEQPNATWGIPARRS
ncbi:MAG TPA: extracellular solute-binding protein, partial [Chloroflexota bacterium]|nr:extracellular solute-binding protein [Chloroflexota bacterium]